MRLFRSRLPATSFKPCLPRFAKTPPTGLGSIHEIKHDGFRMLARRDGEKFRLISRNGNDLTHRFPFAVQALVALPVRSCIIDGEVIVSDSTGLADFSLISGYRRGHCATLCAFDLIELNGDDLRWRPIEERKAALKKLRQPQASRHRVQQALRRRRLDRVPSCLQARMRGYRV